ncbi:MAG: HlyC/CorC family transporter [Ruminococcaceae bacterium]|nr:HlyC/CorC family transporter [Oscillospiraceae bacterium]
MLPSILAMLFCVVMSAYFSATETAFSSLNKTKLKVLADKGDRKAALVLKLSENYDTLISTILIGNNIVNIALASIGTVVFVGLYGDIGATVSTAVITVAVLIFGEITPKSIAKDSPEAFAMFSAPLVRTLIVLLTPLNFLFTQWKRLVARLFKARGDSKMSQEELLQLVEEVEQDGSINADEGELLRNVLEFRDLTAEDILTHRVDVEAVSEAITHEDLAAVFTETRFSRLPVFRETIDHVIGIIHQKDFYAEGGVSTRPLSELITPAVYVRPSEKIQNLLTQLQASKSHVAVVVDEYGGTLGIVTMEDILEELVGEIWDEHDDAVEEFQPQGDGTYRVDGAVNMDDFNEFFDVNCESDSVSLGGWVMEQLESVPTVGAAFNFAHLTVTVTETDGNRLVAAEVKVGERAEKNDDTE